MSVQKNPKNGKWIVRWREGGRGPSRTFDRKGDAIAFDNDIKRRQQLGAGLAGTVIQSRMTLAAFVEEEWWPRYAVPNLKPSTKRRYLEVWGTHIHPRLGGYELRAISAPLVEDFRAQMDAAHVGVQTQRKAMMILQGILRRAVVRGLIQSNYAQQVDKPKQPATRRPQPLPPEMVERIRSHLGHRDRTLVSLLAYGGLRPDEATTARWRDLTDRTLYVHASKTETDRTVRLLAPLAQDLNEWYLASGRPHASHLIFEREQPVQARKRESTQWQLHDQQNWRRRIYQPAARAAGVEDDMRVYRLRGSFVSLLLWEGRSLTYVAEQAGHSVATLAKHYAGVMEELEHQPRVTADEAIRQARTQINQRKAM